MPELPEVETIARQLRKRGIEGGSIVSVAVLWPKTVEPLSVQTFSTQLAGVRIIKISRYGKWMMFCLDSGKTIMIHLRMSGSFSIEAGMHDRIVLELSDGLFLYYSDPRKFGRWKLVDDSSEIIGKLGPDALTDDFSFQYFQNVLQCRKRKIKPLLLDQNVVAGLGNIYVDEALWFAQIHPERLACSLNGREILKLFESIRCVLETGVRNRGTSLGQGRANYRDVDGEFGDHREKVMAYGRDGQPCQRCGNVLKKKTVAQRGTHFCPTCQKE